MANWTNEPWGTLPGGQQASHGRGRAPRIKVECMECNKKFTTTKTTPKCPRCGGYDIDVRS